MRSRVCKAKAPIPARQLGIDIIGVGEGCNERKSCAFAHASCVLLVLTQGQDVSHDAARGLRAWHGEAIPDVVPRLCENLSDLPGSTPLLRCLYARYGETQTHADILVLTYKSACLVAQWL